MTQFWEQFTAWEPIAWILQYETVIWWIASFSAALAIATIVATPWLVCVVPDDYFATKERPRIRGRSRHPILRWTLRILKNLSGLILIVVGLTLTILPGQGTLVVMIGLLLLEFPGKRRLEMWIIRRPGFLKTINWLRERRGRKPLVVWSPESSRQPALPAPPQTSPAPPATQAPSTQAPATRPASSHHNGAAPRQTSHAVR